VFLRVCFIAWRLAADAHALGLFWRSFGAVGEFKQSNRPRNIMLLACLGVCVCASNILRISVNRLLLIVLVLGFLLNYEFSLGLRVRENAALQSVQLHTLFTKLQTINNLKQACDQIQRIADSHVNFLPSSYFFYKINHFLTEYLVYRLGQKTWHFSLSISSPVIDRFSIFLLEHSTDNLQ